MHRAQTNYVRKQSWESAAPKQFILRLELDPIPAMPLYGSPLSSRATFDLSFLSKYHMLHSNQYEENLCCSRRMLYQYFT